MDPSHEEEVTEKSEEPAVNAKLEEDVTFKVETAEYFHGVEEEEAVAVEEERPVDDNVEDPIAFEEEALLNVDVANPIAFDEEVLFNVDVENPIAFEEELVDHKVEDPIAVEEEACADVNVEDPIVFEEEALLNVDVANPIAFDEEVLFNVDVENPIAVEEEAVEEVVQEEPPKNVDDNVLADRAIARLTQERKHWRRQHPFGFTARPTKNADGSWNLLIWDCSIPGKEGTPWAGGYYRFQLIFPVDYPSSPPKCVFEPKLLHPNICDDGSISLLPVFVDGVWVPGYSLEFLLRGIQELLSSPDLKNPMCAYSSDLFRYNHDAYVRRVRALAECWGPGLED